MSGFSRTFTVRLSKADATYAYQDLRQRVDLEAFAGRPSFFTKRMFGGLAAYLHERQMLVLVEPTKTGRWKWHGVLVCTGREHHDSIRADFPALAPHRVLRKWLYVDSTHDNFELTMDAVAARMARNDQRFGIEPRSSRKRVQKKVPGASPRRSTRDKGRTIRR